MRNEIVALAQQQAQAAVRRVAIPAAFACVAGVFFLIALVGLFAALFFWLEAMVGPIAAASIQMVCRICRRNPPTARSTPISRRRSVIETVSAFTIPSTATSTATAICT